MLGLLPVDVTENILHREILGKARVCLEGLIIGVGIGWASWGRVYGREDLPIIGSCQEAEQFLCLCILMKLSRRLDCD